MLPRGRSKAVVCLRLDSVCARWTWACGELATAAAGEIRSQGDMTRSTAISVTGCHEDPIRSRSQSQVYSQRSENASRTPAQGRLGQPEFHAPISEKVRQCYWLFPSLACILSPLSSPHCRVSKLRKMFAGVSVRSGLDQIWEMWSKFREYVVIDPFQPSFQPTIFTSLTREDAINIDIDVICVGGCPRSSQPLFFLPQKMVEVRAHVYSSRSHSVNCNPSCR